MLACLKACLSESLTDGLKISWYWWAVKMLVCYSCHDVTHVFVVACSSSLSSCLEFLSVLLWSAWKDGNMASFEIRSDKILLLVLKLRIIIMMPLLPFCTFRLPDSFLYSFILFLFYLCLKVCLPASPRNTSIKTLQGNFLQHCCGSSAPFRMWWLDIDIKGDFVQSHYVKRML